MTTRRTVIAALASCLAWCLVGPAAAQPTAPTGVGTVSGGPASLCINVAVTPGQFPTSTGITVTADLSAFGGASVADLFDNGFNGDILAGDNLFTLCFAPVLHPQERVVLPFLVRDFQGRSSSGTILFVPFQPYGEGASSLPVVATCGGIKTLLTVTVNATSGLQVKANLFSIGGLSSQTFYDDGTHGDEIADDDVFSFSYVVPRTTAPGTRNLPFTVTDSQGQTMVGHITLTVVDCPPRCTLDLLEYNVIAPGTFVHETPETCISQPRFEIRRDIIVDTPPTPTQFTTRYRRVAAIDSASDADLEYQNVNTAYFVRFGVPVDPAYPTSPWKVRIASRRRGELTTRNDGGGPARIHLDALNWSLLNFSGTLLTTTGSITGDAVQIDSGDGDDLAFDQQSSALLSGTGSGNVKLFFNWTAQLETNITAIGAGGDEAAIRMGLSANCHNFSVGTYPGDNNRVAATDGHIVTVTCCPPLRPCCATFDGYSLEGCSQTGLAVNPLTNPAGDGNSTGGVLGDGYARLESLADAPINQRLQLIGPQCVVGLWSKFAGYLQFDVRVYADGVPGTPTFVPRVSISRSDGFAAASATFIPSGTQNAGLKETLDAWRTIYVPMPPNPPPSPSNPSYGSWALTSGTWADLLGNVTEVRFAGAYTVGPSIIGYDNICIKAGKPPKLRIPLSDIDNIGDFATVDINRSDGDGTHLIDDFSFEPGPWGSGYQGPRLADNLTLLLRVGACGGGERSFDALIDFWESVDYTQNPMTRTGHLGHVRAALKLGCNTTHEVNIDLSGLPGGGITFPGLTGAIELRLVEPGTFTLLPFESAGTGMQTVFPQVAPITGGVGSSSPSIGIDLNGDSVFQGGSPPIAGGGPGAHENRNLGGALMFRIPHKGPAPAPVSTDLGCLPDGQTARTAVLNASEVKWFRFCLAGAAVDPNLRFLDIDTEDSSVDTSIALFNEAGALVAFDDDSGSGVNAQLSFGIGRRAAVGDGRQYDGRNHDATGVTDTPGLLAGIYFLAVAASGSQFDDAFRVVPGASGGGVATVSLRTNANGAPLAPSVPPITNPGDDLGDLTSPGAQIAGVPLDMEAVRWVAFDLCRDTGPANTVQVNLNGTSSVSSAMTLFDATGNLIAQSTQSIDHDPAPAAPLNFGGASGLNLGAGRYYLALTCFSDDLDTSPLGRWHLRSRDGASGFTIAGEVLVSSTACCNGGCPADFNCSGALSVQDIFDFLGAFFGNNPSADFNSSGAISIQDIFDFLGAFFGGCP